MPFEFLGFVFAVLLAVEESLGVDGGSNFVVALAEGYLGKDRPTWTVNGKWVLVAGSAGAQGPLGITAYALDDGRRRSILQPPAPMKDYAPSISPDGRWMVFSRGADFACALYKVAVDPEGKATGEAVRLTQPSFDVMEPVRAAWMDGGELVFSGMGGAWPQILWRVSAIGGGPQPLTFGGASGALLTSRAWLRIRAPGRLRACG